MDYFYKCAEIPQPFFFLIACNVLVIKFLKIKYKKAVFGVCFAKYSTELKTKIVKMQRIRLLVLLLLCVVCQQTFAQQRTISGLVISI